MCDSDLDFQKFFNINPKLVKRLLIDGSKFKAVNCDFYYRVESSHKISIKTSELFDWINSFP